MKSKKLICGALAATLTMSVAFTGCSLLSTLNEEDMKQVIATVDISQSENLKKEGLDEYKAAITSKEIVKRDLIAAFINVGYSSIQSGSSYSTVFKSLVTQLTNNAVITQYATLCLLKEHPEVKSVFEDESKTEAEKYEALLGAEDEHAVNRAKYALYSSINASLDSVEKDIIKNTDTSSSTSSSATLPSGVDKEQDDYYPGMDGGKLDYGIYTGYGDYLLASSGAYQDDALEGSNRKTRARAYSKFIDTLRTNFLITEDDETVTDIWSLNYIQDEYVAQLQQQVINEYYDIFSEEQEKLLRKEENGVYTVLQSKYQSMLKNAEISDSTVSSFETSMSSLSDTSFVLYAPATDDTEGGTFGYVYNILLPFNAVQKTTLDSYSAALSSDGIDQGTYYLLRKNLMKQITTTDRRSSWFTGETDYSFDAAAKEWTAADKDGATNYYNGGDAQRKHLFFENNLTNNERYKELDKYVGKYSYNGTVVKNKDDSYYLLPESIDIDEMLGEFCAYVDYVLGNDAGTTAAVKDSAYDVASSDGYYVDGNEDEIDYSKFVYARGAVDIGEASKLNRFTKDSAQYKAMSAVNELQYAYTTDTGVLSQYIGYSVSAYDTSYIKEFEYAAQEAVALGAGNFTVCAGDYGWHLIYVTDSYSTAGGEVYAGAQWTEERVNTEGTFENLFYNWLKDSELTNITSNKRSTLIQQYGGSTTVTLYEDAYKDLLEIS